MTTRYDAIVIGTGQAGPALAVRLAKAGRKTAIIERKRFGVTGVSQAKVDMKAASAVVTFNDAVTSPEKLAIAVTEAGFPAQPRKGGP